MTIFKISNRFSGRIIFEVETESFKTCVEMAVESNIDLTWADLTGADLTGADLTGANLTWADLTGANLTGANLTCADMTGADLTGSDLTGANLTWADLTGADLTGANMTWADLTCADMTGADLTGADLDFSSLPLWCGSKDIIIDEKISMQLGMHVFNLIEKFWPDGLTENQKEWLNNSHRIKDGSFHKF